MKGMVFTEFLEMVEEKFGFDVVDNILEASKDKLSTGGAYTAIGTYSHGEIITLVTNLSTETNIPIPHLVHVFGTHLLGQFAAHYTQFFEEANNTFEFLESIDNHIHIEVLKLYPDAELPRFKCFHPDDKPNELTMIYSSERAMSDLAAGLIEGAIKYYKENITFTKMDLDNSNGKIVKFDLIKS
ncbi:MAG: hypothetical protein HC803_07045 [Saprospiraceae bacterium]|nr:hypothetical protein [Saprospiraceae bacterium]